MIDMVGQLSSEMTTSAKSKSVKDIRQLNGLFVVSLVPATTVKMTDISLLVAPVWINLGGVLCLKARWEACQSRAYLLVLCLLVSSH